jgi:hypothetical protein
LKRNMSLLIEADPNGKNPKEAGAKLDQGKVPIWRGAIDYFPRAIRAVAGISEYGAKKYAWKGWETVPDGISRYTDAMVRHVFSETIEGPNDIGPNGSGLLHKAHTAWNALAALELYLREQEKND